MGGAKMPVVSFAQCKNSKDRLRRCSFHTCMAQNGLNGLVDHTHSLPVASRSRVALCKLLPCSHRQHQHEMRTRLIHHYADCVFISCTAQKSSVSIIESLLAMEFGRALDIICCREDIEPPSQSN
jgi:hypothetical protein